MARDYNDSIDVFGSGVTQNGVPALLEKHEVVMPRSQR